MNVLLVEDNPGDVDLVREVFEGPGSRHALHVVGDGEAALDFLARRGAYVGAPRPHLVLLDLNIPRKHGHEVLAIVKRDPELASIPVVILTSSDNDREVAHCYSLHANAYVVKPNHPEPFFGAIRAIERFWLQVARLSA